MIDVRAQEMIRCSPDAWLAFVLDVERYAEVDDKIGPIAWTRRRGDVVEFKFAPRLPGVPLPGPRIVSRMRLTPGQRIDVRLAPFPRNLTSRLASRFSAAFSCEPHADGALVTRAISFDFRVPFRWFVEPVLRRTLPASVQRELRMAKSILEAAAP